MNDIIWWKYCAWFALFASPAIPLAFAWRSYLNSGRPRRPGVLIPIAVASFSLIWFVAATMNFRFIGPLYGMLHYAVTGGNLGTVSLCALWSLIMIFRRGMRAARIATALACLMLAVEWTLIGIAYR
jgi:hypothetical protein